MSKSFDYLLKICIFGNQGVGKSTFVNSCLKKFIVEESKVDIKDKVGVSFHHIIIEVDGIRVKLQLWELSASKRYKFLFNDYVRGSAGGIFICDITDKSSLKKLDNWLEIFRGSKKNINVPILMVSNKADLQDERKISLEEASELATSKSLIGDIGLSAKDETAVEKLIINFIRIILHIDRKRALLVVFKNEMYLRILNLLRVFNELSLTEISYHIGRSKATISRRTRELIRLGLIKSHSKDDEPQAGTIKRKYYTLSQDFYSLIGKYSFDLEEIKSKKDWGKVLEILSGISYMNKIMNLIFTNSSSFLEATENLLLSSLATNNVPMIDTLTLLVEVMGLSPINLYFLTENQFEKVLTLSNEFHSKLEEIIKTDESEVKPYIYMDMMHPILNTIKYGDIKPGKYISTLRKKEIS